MCYFLTSFLFFSFPSSFITFLFLLLLLSSLFKYYILPLSPSLLTLFLFSPIIYKPYLFLSYFTSHTLLSFLSLPFHSMPSFLSTFSLFFFFLVNLSVMPATLTLLPSLCHRLPDLGHSRVHNPAGTRDLLRGRYTGGGRCVTGPLPRQQRHDRHQQARLPSKGEMLNLFAPSD